MKDVFLLTKVLLNGSKSQMETKGNKFKKYFLVVFAFAYLMGFMGYTSHEAIKSLMVFKIEYMYLKLALMGMFTFYTMQTIIAGLNVLFFSKDIETLLPLPIKANKLVMAKMNVLIISEYLTGLLILAPVLVVYGYMLKLGAIYYLLATLGFLLLPVIPVIAMSLLVTIIMKFTNIIRNKNVVQYLSIVLTIVLVFAIEFLGGTANENVTQEDIANNITNINAVADEYSALYMPVKPIYEMLMNYNNLKGLESLIQISILSIAVYIVGTNLLAKIYLRIITSLNKSGKKKTKKTIEYKIASARKAFFDRDIKILVRNPNFFLQAFLTPFIMTAFLIGYVVTSFKDIPAADMEFIRGYINEGYPFAILLGVVAGFFTFNFISVTAYSRDGKDAKVLKYLPVSFDKQIAYKTLPGVKINFVLMIIFLVAIKFMVPTISLINLGMLLIFGTLINIYNNYLGVIIDLKNPKLHWTHEYAVVKQNFNMFIQMGLLAIQIAAIIYLGYRLQNLNKIAIIVALAYSILIIMMKLYVKKNAKKLYSKID